MTSKEESFSLTWAIENFRIFLSERDGQLKSPFWKTEINGNNVGLVLSVSQLFLSVYFELSALENDVPIEIVELSLISSCGEIPLKNWSNQCFSIEYNKILGDNGQSVLPNDILTVRCRMWAKAMKPGASYINSVLHKVQLSWKIKKFDKSLSYEEQLISKDSLLFLMTLEKSSEQASHMLTVRGLTGKGGWTSFIRCKPLNLPFEVLFNSFNSLRTNCQIGIRITAENNTDITLSMKCVVAFHKNSLDKLPCHFCSDRKTVSQGFMPSNTLGNDLLLLYRESRHCDVTINTYERSLSAHKSILSARSSVFRAMFEKDKMSEGQFGVVDIEDIDGDTMDRMLVFLYSNSLKELNWKEALELYYAADKYDVIALKQKCACILKDQLATDNVCEVLVLADSHSDEKLMVCVMDFIYCHGEVISSVAWRELEASNSRLTAKVLRNILMKKK